MTDINFAFRMGSRFLPSAGTPSLQTFQLAASNTAYASIFRARDKNAITHLGFNYASRTGTPPTYRVSLQGITASTGAPNGTVLGGGSPASGTFTPPASSAWDATWQWVALTNSYTPTLGEEFAVVVDYSSGTINSSNAGTFNTHLTGWWSNTLAHSSCNKQTTGSWSRNANPAILGVRTASTRYGLVFQSLYNTRSAATNGHRRALKFALPSGIFADYTVTGATIAGSCSNNTGKNPVFGLWSSSAAINTATMDSDFYSNPTSSYQIYDMYLQGAGGGDVHTPLNPGTNYYIGWEVADALNSGLLINGWQLAEAADRSAWEGGTNMCLSSYDGSNWTDDTTVYPWVQVQIAAITTTTGTSIARMPSMAGGMVG